MEICNIGAEDGNTEWESACPPRSTEGTSTSGARSGHRAASCAGSPDAALVSMMLLHARRRVSEATGLDVGDVGLPGRLGSVTMRLSKGNSAKCR